VPTVPEGDTVHRAARRLQALVGDVLEATSPNPRGLATRVAEHVDGRRLESVQAHGKNLVLRFEGGVVVRSHLGMKGRWIVRPAGGEVSRAPWLVLRGRTAEALLLHGRALELHTRALAGLGPDILERPPHVDAMIARIRSNDAGRYLGETLLDQRLVAGIGNKWLAEALWAAELSPWRRTADVSDEELTRALSTAAEQMNDSLEGGFVRNAVYRLVGRPCRRCGATIRSYGQGDANRMTYWCPGCQRGGTPPGA
jgi:endonuclease VIII